MPTKKPGFSSHNYHEVEVIKINHILKLTVIFTSNPEVNTIIVYFIITVTLSLKHCASTQAQHGTHKHNFIQENTMGYLEILDNSLVSLEFTCILCPTSR